MTSKQQRPPQPPTKEDRLAKALRENLARRKALVRARKSQAEAPDALLGDVSGGAEKKPHDDESL